MKERGNWYLKRILRGGRREVPGGQWWLGETEIFYILQNKGMFVWESSPGECHETMSPASSWGLVSQILLWFSLQAQLWEVFSKFSWMTERETEKHFAGKCLGMAAGSHVPDGSLQKILWCSGRGCPIPWHSIHQEPQAQWENCFYIFNFFKCLFPRSHCSLSTWWSLIGSIQILILKRDRNSLGIFLDESEELPKEILHTELSMLL